MWVASFVALTVVAGLALRWDLATGWVTALGLEFPDLRHAHSHVGFYGFLTIAWWLVLREVEGVSLGPRFVASYAAAVLATSALFAVMGYAAPTIALSTLVAGYWAVVAWRSRRAHGWLALPPWAVVVGLLLVPAIAVMAKRDFALSRQLAHVFIAVMLLWAFVPMALAALKVPRVAPLAWASSNLLGSTYLVFSESWPWPLGWMTALAGFALLGPLRAVARGWPAWLQALWGGFVIGLVVVGVTPPLQTEATRLAALHFTALGPLGGTLLYVWAPDRARSRAWAVWVALGALGAMLAAMVAVEALGHALAMKAAAWAGTVLVGAIAALLVPGRGGRGRGRKM